MSAEAYHKFKGEIRKNGLLIYDADLVKPTGKMKAFPIPAIRFAEELGNRIFANLVILGFITAVTKIVSLEAMKQAIPDSVPERYIEINMKAFDRGYEYGQKMLAEAGSEQDREGVQIMPSDAKKK